MAASVRDPWRGPLSKEEVRGALFPLGARSLPRRPARERPSCEIARLVRDALQRRAREMRACGAALDPDEQTARVHVPVRRAETGERRHEIHAVVARETRRERLGLVRACDEAEAVA